MIAKSCNIQKMLNLMGFIQEISYFLNLLPKRAIFERCWKIIWYRYYKRQVNGCWFKSMGCSNWCNGSFWNFFTIIVYALEKMKDNAKPDIHFNDDTSKKTSNLYKSCYYFDFVVALVITRSILSCTSAVIELVQKSLMIYYMHIIY